MKIVARFSHWASACVVLIALSVHGQGTFVYDQQSATDTNFLNLDSQVNFGQQPLGQSFTPSLSAVGFAQFRIYGGDFGPGGAFYVNLRTNSITGSILGSTDPVTITNSFDGVVNFLFSTPVALTPGTTYYFQPVSQNAQGWALRAGPLNYSGGTAFANGIASDGTVPGYPDYDLWFREGVAVPEPSSAALVLVGVGVLAGARLVKRQR